MLAFVASDKTFRFRGIFTTIIALDVFGMRDSHYRIPTHALKANKSVDIQYEEKVEEI